MDDWLFRPDVPKSDSLHVCVVCCHMVEMALIQSFLVTSTRTGLLAFRIWRIQKDMVDNAVRRNLIPLIAIIVESGAVYAVAVLVLLAIYAARSWAEYMILDILPSLIVSLHCKSCLLFPN